jgi:AcrR family transcriptional regulator
MLLFIDSALKFGHPSLMAVSASQNARSRARTELTREIKAAAQRQLAEVGSAGLSLRAVARDLGLASSAVYRYFPSRDELLTALIIDAFDAVGAVAEAADAACLRDDIAGRWVSTAQAVRAWALANRHEYALIYGTPVPGYHAPGDTLGPSLRVTGVFLGILRDAADAGRGTSSGVVAASPDMNGGLYAPFAPDIDDAELTRGLMAWILLFGSISFELFGHLHNVVVDRDAFFELEMGRIAEYVGLPPA